MYITCLDMEGVLVPEIWIEFARESGIPELTRTTRDEPDYDKLMKWRLGVLRNEGRATPAHISMAKRNNVNMALQTARETRQILGAMGMVTGYCGTLFTPMAANFNIVPVALLELPNQGDVIRAQWKTGAALLVVNLILMYLLVFRF